MNDDRDWERLSQKVFIQRDVQAPPYLWTRVLAAIEAREAQLNEWWQQLRWMGRFATVMATLVLIAAGTVIYEELQGAPLEHLLQGTAASAPTLAEAPAGSETITTALLVEGGSSWEPN